MKPVDPRLLRRASAARRHLAVAVGLGLVTTGLVLAQATLLAHALAGAFAGDGVAALRGTLLALLAVVAGRALTAYAGEVAALRAAVTVKSQLREQLLAHSAALGPAWLSGQRSGEIATLATRGLDALDGWFARYLPQLVLASIVPFAVVARVFLADHTSALVIAVTLPLIPVFMVLVGLHTKTRTEQQWQLLVRLGGHFLDAVEGLPTLKVFRRAKAQAETIRRVTEAHRLATMATLRVAFLSAFVLELLATLSVALVAVEVGLRLLHGGLPYETALLVLLLAPEAYLPLRQVGLHFHASTEGLAAADQALTVLETPLPARRPATATVDLRTQPIRLDGVTLTHPGRAEPALAGVTLTIEPGRRLVVVGDSGAGKSTLLSLLLRFTEPDDGRITVGGADLRDVDLDAWRSQVAWVPQRPHLFAASVADNIRLGSGTDDAAVRRAAELAGADTFVRALPDGYATVLGEAGRDLSAGQRQRIALARAFLRDAPLLLLDEPTAHLDADSTQAVRDAVERLMAGRTVVLVAHGHGWAGAADGVVRLAHGRLQEPTLAAAS